MTEDTGMNIVTNCAKCWQTLEFFGERCTECQEEFDNSQTILAHNLVDEGNLQYRNQWLITTEPSGHDWVAPLTRTPKGEREEFTEPIVHLTDRLDDRDLELLPTEAVCNWCHLTFLAKRVTCPTCEQADA